MNLVFDVGNTTTKISAFRDGKLLEQQRVTMASWRQLEASFNAEPAQKIILSSVRHIDYSWLQDIRTKAEVLVFDWQTPVPIINNYTTPETLGADRLANAVAASVLFPNNDVLVIDFGTCIKYDLVRSGVSYEGGAISPGMSMRFQALHNFTDKLPLISYAPDFPLIGRSTASSIGSGVVHGIVAEVNHTIGLYREHYPALKVIATGGDQHFFDNFFKNSIFAHHFLTALGLHEILLHNL